MPATRLLSAMVATWNNVATTFTGLKLNVTDTASASGSLLMDLQVGGSTKFNVDKSGVVLAGSGAMAAPTYSFAGDPNTGIYNSSADVLDITTAGVARWRVNGNGHLLATTTNAYDIGASGANRPRNTFLAGSGIADNGFASGSGGALRFSSTADAGAAADVLLFRDAANTLAQRNGTSAQAFNVYNTYTDASNYERGGLVWSGNDFYLATNNVGTGVARSLIFATNNLPRWRVEGSTGHFQAATDNTYDIGASGANRPRNVFVAGLGSFANYVAAAGIYPGGSLRSYINSGSDGTISLSNNAGSNSVQLTVGASNLLTLNGGLTTTNDLIVPAGKVVYVGDTGMSRLAFNSLALGSSNGSSSASLTLTNLNAGGYVKTQSTTVAGLTAAATAGAGARSFVTDANATMAAGIGTVVVGGGSNMVPVYSDGTNWLIG